MSTISLCGLCRLSPIETPAVGIHKLIGSVCKLTHYFGLFSFPGACFSFFGLLVGRSPPRLAALLISDCFRQPIIVSSSQEWASRRCEALIGRVSRSR